MAAAALSAASNSLAVSAYLWIGHTANGHRAPSVAAYGTAAFGFSGGGTFAPRLHPNGFKAWRDMPSSCRCGLLGVGAVIEP